ncbi:hypothetical protein BDW75DRAFT_207862 [Aspergillus navahoensis]
MASNNKGQKATGPKSRYGEGLQLRALNVEKGSERYPIADDIYPPRTSSWRCNLTALSQRRNLFFVACGHQIYVWEPAGPSQILGSKPEMIVTPVMKEPQAAGYIRPTSPHEINSILVDDLGREEVLLLVTDSGNVCGYRVEAIYSSLKRAADNGKVRPLDGSDMEPFFIEYVGASAWGLAIHKFARLIAVSANTGYVTVFAFALVSPGSDKGDDSFRQLEMADDATENSQTWLHIRTEAQFRQLQQLMPEKHRTRNIKLTYSGHFTNIPSVGFLNTDYDPNGMWMVSTDIYNRTIVWNVWESLGPFNEYHLNNVAPWSIPEDAYLDDGDRGWSVIALDPRSFHLVKTEEEACGGQPRRRAKNKHKILDLTNLTKRIPDSSRLYNHFPPAVKAEPEETLLPDFFSADCLINGTHNAQENSDARRTKSAVACNLRNSASAEVISHQAVDGSLHADDLSGDSASDSDHNAERHLTTGRHALLRALTNDPGRILSPEGVLEIALRETAGVDIHEVQALLSETMGNDEDDDHFHLEMEVDTSEYGGGTSEEEESAQQPLDDFGLHFSTPPPNSNFPILHLSHTNICLIPHPFSLNASVVCGAPLLQRFTQPVISIRGFDRFNMVKYIPEHGIVVAASQKGRAAIIALTESPTIGRTFRVDWIVPLESQEKYGERPLFPLLGMSVAPMQGFEIHPDVPYIPQGGPGHDCEAGDMETETEPSMSANDLLFQYKEVNNPSPTSRSESEQEHLTLPECHARATRSYQPEESWRGWNPSRRYRLMLMYAEHTVMSYEFWYTWNVTGGNAKTRAGVGAAADSDGTESESEVEYLIL